MPINRLEAKAAMKALFWDTWKAGTPPLNNGQVIPVLWDNQEKPDAPEPTGPYARFSIRHDAGPLQTINPRGSRRYKQEGSVIVQLFAPLGEGEERLDRMVKVVVDGMRGRPCGGGDAVNMRDAIPTESGRVDGVRWACFVGITFDYEEHG